jgi:hydroxymethylbilane synthase
MIVATRGSALALWQANHVRDRLLALGASTVELLVMKTRGDKILDRALSEVGGKGLFVKEIEEALLDRRAHVAVHSMKDLPADVPAELTIAAIPEREDARDALLVRPGLTAKAVAELPEGAKVGTSSLRRVCQLKARRRDLQIIALRGNVDTRLRKLQAGEFDAIVLACAGLKRLGHADSITAALTVEESLPAIGQGALAIECRGDDAEVRGYLEQMNHAPTELCVTAERAFLARLSGGCQTPLAAHATLDGDGVVLEGLVGAPDGSKLLRERLRGTDPTQVGTQLADLLLSLGADAILAAAQSPGVVGGE